MGAAALHRGNIAIRRSLEDEACPVEFRLMIELGNLEKNDDHGRINWTDCPVIEFVPCNGGWWMQDPKTTKGFFYRSLRDAVRRWDIQIIGYDCGKWIAGPDSKQN